MRRICFSDRDDLTTVMSSPDIGLPVGLIARQLALRYDLDVRAVGTQVLIRLLRGVGLAPAALLLDKATLLLLKSLDLFSLHLGLQVSYALGVGGPAEGHVVGVRLTIRTREEVCKELTHSCEIKLFIPKSTFSPGTRRAFFFGDGLSFLPHLGLVLDIVLAAVCVLFKSIREEGSGTARTGDQHLEVDVPNVVESRIVLSIVRSVLCGINQSDN